MCLKFFTSSIFKISKGQTSNVVVAWFSGVTDSLSSGFYFDSCLVMPRALG